MVPSSQLSAPGWRKPSRAGVGISRHQHAELKLGAHDGAMLTAGTALYASGAITGVLAASFVELYRATLERRRRRVRAFLTPRPVRSERRMHTLAPPAPPTPH